MSGKAAGPIRQAWYRWKALKLPWRKRFLVGLDLQGNTFWEFRDTLSSHKHRMRRIVQYPTATQYSDIKISPQWHQWLRHTRQDAPSLTEQSMDLVRQRNLKKLAAQADARWAAKPSFLDSPDRAQPLPTIGVRDPGGYVDSGETSGVRNAVGGGLGGEVQEAVGEVGEVLDEGSRKEDDAQSDEPARRQPSTRVKEKKVDNDPWKQARGGPSEEWQPQAWEGNLAPRKR